MFPSVESISLSIGSEISECVYEKKHSVSCVLLRKFRKCQARCPEEGEERQSQPLSVELGGK